MSSTVALVDEHVVCREGVRLVLERAGLRVVAEGDTGRDAIRIAERPGAPDVLVTEVSLRDMNGLVATREIATRNPRCRVLFLSALHTPYLIARALASGARGFARKSQSAPEVVAAVETVARGERYLPRDASAEVLEEMLDARNRDHGADSPLGVLSRRELEIFELLVRGFTNRQVASALFISPRTVETHRAHVLHKLRVHSLADLVRFAATHELLVG